MAPGDQVATDVEAAKAIKSFEGTDLAEDPWSYSQIRRADELFVGVKSEQKYRVIKEE
jgi:hypothetical protein